MTEPEQTPLRMESVEIGHELEVRCAESKRLRALARFLRRDLVLARARAGETRVNVLHHRLRQKVSSATAAQI